LTILASVLVAIAIWLYVQVTINPVVTRTFSINVTYRGAEIAKSNGYLVQMPLETIQISLMGRQKTISGLSTANLEAYVDLATIEQTGLNTMPVSVDTASLSYLRPTLITPSTITVSVRKASAN
jgi:uncharacterized membrane protein